jgi:hypothetical protein
MSGKNEAEEEKSRSAPTTVYVTDEDVIRYEPSVTLSIFVCWILPVLVIAVMTRFAVDREATFNFPPSRPIAVDLSKNNNDRHPAPAPSAQPQPQQQQSEKPKPTAKRPKKKEEPPPTLIADKPTGYIEVVQAIKRRRLDWESTDADPIVTFSDDDAGGALGYSASEHEDDASSSSYSSFSSESSSSNERRAKMKEPPRGASSDPVRMQHLEKIDHLRSEHKVKRIYRTSLCAAYLAESFCPPLRSFTCLLHFAPTALCAFDGCF